MKNDGTFGTIDSLTISYDGTPLLWQFDGGYVDLINHRDRRGCQRRRKFSAII
jgi:hypothetical protein